MTERCRYAGADQPRELPDGEPCGERHCTTCGYRHLDSEPLTCPTCVGQVRQNLAEVVRLSAPVRLLTEAAHRGVNSEAATLAGPVADPEAWNHVEASVLCGRLPRDWQERADHPRHPLAVLGWFDMIVRDHLEQPTDDPITVESASAYLDKHLSMLAQDPLFDFADLASEVGRCLGHVEDVLREGERAQRGVSCPACGQARVEKSWADEDDGGDRWTCPRCHQWWTDSDYRAKVEGTFVQVATELTASQIARTYRVPEGSVRGWASLGKVRKRGRNHEGLTLYVVADVLAMRDSEALSRVP